MKYVLMATALLCVGYVLVNVPSCEGGGVKRVNGEWVTFKTLSGASLSWPRTTARIVKSELKRSSKTGSGGRTPRVRFRVRYEFSIDGEGYEGSTVQFVAATDKEKETWAKRFLKYERVEVSYDPENPRLSVIIPGAGR